MATYQEGTQNEGFERIMKSDMVSDTKATEGQDYDDERTGAEMQGKQKNVEPLGLLDLPGEIRNKIYRLALVTTHSSCPVECFIYSLDPPDLALVNKQIHAEALPIYYAENYFYLMLWADLEWPRDRDPTDFNRFTRMMEYFGRLTTSPMDRSPMRYIKNIVVQIRTFTHDDPLYYSQVYSTILDDTLTPPATGPRYSSLCIRGEQQRINFTATDEEHFDPTGYQWFPAGAHPTLHFFSPWKEFPHFLCSVQEAYDLVQMSFAGRTQPMDEAIRLAYHYQRRQKWDTCWGS